MKKIEELLKELHAENDYKASEDFIADGILDSFDLMRLLVMIESEYGVKICAGDLIPNNFNNLHSIRDLIHKYGVEDCE